MANERRREEQERRERERNAEAIGKQRETLKNLADVLDDPSSPSVNALRKKFSTTKYEQEEEKIQGECSLYYRLGFYSDIELNGKKLVCT